MRILYFAAVRERVGTGAEDVELPGAVETVADLVAWLCRRGPEYEVAFGSGPVLAAVDRLRVPNGASVSGASEIAFFPPMTGG